MSIKEQHLVRKLDRMMDWRVFVQRVHNLSKHVDLDGLDVSDDRIWVQCNGKCMTVMSATDEKKFMLFDMSGRTPDHIQSTYTFYPENFTGIYKKILSQKIS